MFFKSFYAANMSIMSSISRVPINKERISNNWHVLHGKKIEKDKENQILKIIKDKALGLDC